MFSCTSEMPEAGCISLDITQAFDTLSWDYMQIALQKFGIPQEYTQWIQILYHLPTARVRTGSHISQPYQIQRGTRQGCPQSPILFVMTLKPLAHRIRAMSTGWYSTLNRTHHALSLYADDIILYTRRLQDNLENVEQIFTQFESIAGLSINYDKSYAFPFGNETDNQNIPFGNRNITIAHTTFKYLGIQIYRKD